jgi:hypothetical protein
MDSTSPISSNKSADSSEIGEDWFLESAVLKHPDKTGVC